MVMHPLHTRCISLSTSLDVNVTWCSPAPLHVWQSGGEARLFCVVSAWTRNSPPPPHFCLPCHLASLALTVTTTTLLAGRAAPGEAACRLCQSFGKTSRVRPRVRPGRGSAATSSDYTEIPEKKENDLKTIFLFCSVLILGCRKGRANSWAGIGICYGFLRSFNFRNALLTSKDSVLHVKFNFDLYIRV